MSTCLLGLTPLPPPRSLNIFVYRILSIDGDAFCNANGESQFEFKLQKLWHHFLVSLLWLVCLSVRTWSCDQSRTCVESRERTRTKHGIRSRIFSTLTHKWIAFRYLVMANTWSSNETAHNSKSSKCECSVRETIYYLDDRQPNCYGRPIVAKFNSRSTLIQPSFSVNSMLIQCQFNVSSMLIQCQFNAYSMSTSGRCPFYKIRKCEYARFSNN